MTREPEDIPVAAELIQELSEEFDAMTLARHEMGAEKYGPVRFTEVDSIQMALEEIVDLSNYARYTYIKLRLLQIRLQTGDIVFDGSTAQPTQEFMTFRKD
jgi:hypothetical protein